MTDNKAQNKPLCEYDIPRCKCGAPAHIVANIRCKPGEVVTSVYGVECEGKRRHHTPLGFSTPRSALIFWGERYADT